MYHSSSNHLILHIEQLVVTEQFRDGLNEIDNIRKNSLDIGDQLKLGVLESRCFRGLGENNRALTAAQSVVDLGTGLPEHKIKVIEGFLEMAAASWGLAQPDMIFESCAQAERLSRELQVDNESILESIKADILSHKSIGYYHHDDVHRGIECALESLSIREKLGNELDIVDSLMRVGYLYYEVDSDQTLYYLEKGLELNKRLDRKGPIILALCCKTLIEVDNGNWDEAEEFAQQSLNLATEHDHGRWMLFILFNFAVLYYSKGDFKKSEEFYQKIIDLSEKVGARLLTCLSSNNLGDIFRARGDFTKALKCFERSMEINRKIGRVKGYIIGLANCGLVQHAIGHSDKALELLEESLSLSVEQEQAGLLGGLFRSYILVNIVSILVDKGMINEAKHRVENARQISEETKNHYDAQAYRIAAALVLKSSLLPANRVMAKEYLIEVVDGEFFDYELMTLALLHLSELLVNELQMTGDVNVLDDLDNRLTKLSAMASEQESSLLLVETRLLQSKVALLQLEADKASVLLDQAESTAEQKGLQMITKRIINERDLLLNELVLWEKLGENKPSMDVRIETVQIQEKIGDIIKQGFWRKMLF